MTTTPLHVQVGMEIRVLRTRQRMQSRELAHAAGIHPMSVSKIERGAQGDVGVETLTKIAKVLGTTASALVRAAEENRHQRIVGVIAVGAGRNDS